MSMAALRWARSVRGITSTQKFVLVMLADQANDYGEAWPSALLLAADCCLTDRAVRDAMDALEDAGLISGDRQIGRATRWCIHIGRAPEPRSETPARRSDTPEPRSALPASEGTTPNPGTTFLPPPERGSDPPRKLVPTTPERGSDRTLKNPHLTPIQPSTRATPKQHPMRGFDEFWRAYPRKVGKGAAEKAWPKALEAAGGDPEEIIMAVKVAIGTDLLDMREGGRFCPHASTWLNRKGWLDGIEPEPSPQPPLFPRH